MIRVGIMPKRTKTYVEIDEPIWPHEDPDIHEIVRVAFLQTYPGMMHLSIYHIAFHDKDAVTWTAWVSANAYNRDVRYYQLYHDGNSSVFLTAEFAPNNTNIRGYEFPNPKEAR